MIKTTLSSEQMYCKCLKLTLADGFGEVARVRLYILRNDLHDPPYGFAEDLYVIPRARREGLSQTIMRHLIDEAKLCGCYKLITTSRYSHPTIHAMCKDLGFRDHGFEFRIDFFDPDVSKK